jgi:hypothetical protein
MDNEQIERERRMGRIAGILGLLGAVVFVVSYGLAPDFNGAEEAERLKVFDDQSNAVLVQGLLQALALLLFIPPLFAFFRAVQARAKEVRPGLVGITILAPLLLAISVVITYFAYDAAANAFLDPSAGLDQNDNDVASDTFYDQFATQLRTGVGIAGALGVTFSVVYTSLHAMRTGLMTRFWGTLGMALGIGSILFGSPILIVFFITISLLVAGFWPQGRPPAWDAGVAMPWPKAGEDPVVPEREEEQATPADFEGSATEIPDEGERPGRRDNKRKRKRKQR